MKKAALSIITLSIILLGILSLSGLAINKDISSYQNIQNSPPKNVCKVFDAPFEAHNYATQFGGLIDFTELQEEACTPSEEDLEILRLGCAHNSNECGEGQNLCQGGEGCIYLGNFDIETEPGICVDQTEIAGPGGSTVTLPALCTCTFRAKCKCECTPPIFSIDKQFNAQAG